MIMNYITVDEISEILDELEVEYEVDFDETEDPIITCVMSDEPFNLAPLGQGPFYDSFLLRTVIIPDLDPAELCNQFNRTEMSGIQRKLNSSAEYSIPTTPHQT